MLTGVIAGKQKKIQFEFDVQEDNPAEVAEELVEQLIESQPPEKKPQNHEDLQAFTNNLTAHFTQHIESAGTRSCRCSEWLRRGFRVCGKAAH